jgi:hypothetical protein
VCGLVGLRSWAARAHRGLVIHNGIIGKLIPQCQKQQQITNCPPSRLQDSDYRGTVRVLVENCHSSKINMAKNTSWFQLILLKTFVGQLEQVETLAIDTDRGVAKFGSTGNTSDDYALQQHREQQQQEQAAKDGQVVAPAEVGEAAEAARHQQD